MPVVVGDLSTGYRLVVMKMAASPISNPLVYSFIFLASFMMPRSAMLMYGHRDKTKFAPKGWPISQHRHERLG